jgi:hypothetical protein
MSNYWLTKEQISDWIHDHKPISALDRVGIRRLLLYIKKDISQYVDCLDDKELYWEEVTASIQSYIADLMYNLHRRKAFKTYVVSSVDEKSVCKMRVAIQPHAVPDMVEMHFTITRLES